MIPNLIYLALSNIVPWAINKINNKPARRIVSTIWQLVSEEEHESERGIKGETKRNNVISKLHNDYPKLIKSLNKKLGESEAEEFINKTINQCAQHLHNTTSQYEAEEFAAFKNSELSTDRKIIRYAVEILRNHNHNSLADDLLNIDISSPQYVYDLSDFDLEEYSQKTGIRIHSLEV